MADDTTGGPVHGTDGRLRCPWAGASPDYLAYHDDEWGKPVHGEQALFERIMLEAFQSGLSWITILRKREGFRTAFSGFDPDIVAAFTAEDVERLMQNAGIVRNRQKINAAINNAKATIALRASGGLDAFIWSFAPIANVPPATMRSVGQGAQKGRLCLCGSHDSLCCHAGDRYGERSPGGLSCAVGEHFCRCQRIDCV